MIALLVVSSAVSRVMLALVLAGVALTLATLSAVVLERALFALRQGRRQSLERRFRPAIARALNGDAAAMRELTATPRRHRITLFRLLLEPLIDDRDPRRIARTRTILRSMFIMRIADRYLRSWWPWRRALALRALGLIRVRHRTARIVAALDDPHRDVRAAALDALTDLQDPASLRGLVVRMNDASLHRGRRLAALTAFGPRCEPLLLELARIDPAHRAHYARTLAVCGTKRARPRLCEWTGDPRMDVRAAAFEALAHVGLDRRSASLAMRALDWDDPPVRAMAAFALGAWRGPGGAASRLAWHLDDTWIVAVRAARSLASLGRAGVDKLRVVARRTDLGGVLARQMLWERSRCHGRSSRSLRSAS